MNEKMKHLEFIQNIIVRMAKNSFFLKGWTVTLVSGLFMVGSVIGSNILVCLVVIVPIGAFWILDAYYLSQERKYRALYEKIRNIPIGQVDFDLNSNKPELKCRNNSWLRCVFTKSELWFYVAICLASIAIILLVYFI